MTEPKPVKNKSESGKPLRHKSFAARELQLSIAVLAVLALLGGLVLQSISKALTTHFGFATPVLGVLLIVGYIAIVVLLALFFAHRLIGPFRRLEYEMKRIAGGEYDRRLTVRNKDDLHIRNFVASANKFLSEFEQMSIEYNKLSSLSMTKLKEIREALESEKIDCVSIKKEIVTLEDKLHKFREKW